MTTPLRDRLDGLASTGVEGIELRRPDLASAGSSRRPHFVLRLAVLVFVALLAGLLWIAVRDQHRVDTVDSTPTPPPTWPAQPADPVAPTALPRLAITAPGFTATNADESTHGPQAIGGEASKARVWRRVGSPWSLIEVRTFPAAPGQGVGSCPGLGDAALTPTEACDFSGNGTFFEVAVTGRAFDVIGLGVDADLIRAFVDDLGSDLFVTDVGSTTASPRGWDLVAAGTPNFEFPQNLSATIYAQLHPDGSGPELDLTAGSSLTAFDQLIAFRPGGPSPTVREVGDRVVAMVQDGNGVRALWMEGDNVVATFRSEGLTMQGTVDAIGSIRVDPSVWAQLLGPSGTPACPLEGPPTTCSTG